MFKLNCEFMNRGFYHGFAFCEGEGKELLCQCPEGEAAEKACMLILANLITEWSKICPNRDVQRIF